jgi:hypothetical protein
MSLTRFPRGVSSFGVPLIGSGPIVTTGTVYFVDDSGSNNNSGLDPTQPFATLAYAESQCTAGVGDVIVLMPGHAETVSTAITLNTQGLKVVGLGHGALRPNFTVGVAGDIITLDADDIWVDNIMFTGHATTAATSFMNLNGNDDLTLTNIHFQALADPEEMVTVAASTDRLHIENCFFEGTAANLNNCIIFEGGCDTVTIKNCLFDVTDSGCDDGCIWFSVSCTGVLIDNCISNGNGDGEEFIQVAATSTGTVRNCGGTITDQTDWILITSQFGVINTYFAEAGKRSGGELIATNLVPGTSAAA